MNVNNSNFFFFGERKRDLVDFCYHINFVRLILFYIICILNNSNNNICAFLESP